MFPFQFTVGSRMISRLYTFWLFPFIAVCAACAQDPTNDITGRITDYGTYKVIEAGEDVPVRSEAGEVEQPAHRSKKIEFLTHTNRVVAGKGTSFGYTFELSNVRTNGSVLLEIETIHPEMVLPNGHRDSGRVLQVYCESRDGRWQSHVGYRFDEDFELIEGAWTISVSTGNRRLVSKSFDVVR